MNHSVESDPIVDDITWQDARRAPIAAIKEQLEARAKTGCPMQQFSLAREDLTGVNLVNQNASCGYQLTHSDLYRANLQGAHLFMLDLSGSSLMKANLSNANLHYANLQNCNLLGVILKGAKIEHVHWGDQVVQERLGLAEKDRQTQIELFQQAEEIYRNLRQVAEHQGLFEFAGHFFQKEMVMRRLQLPHLSFKRNFSKLVDLFCGYGESPLRVVAFSVFIIVVFATLYFFSGLSFSGESLAYAPNTGVINNIKIYLSALYFSVVTFTTLGYGDLAPVGVARALAAFEAFIGSFTLALFVVVFVKKMTR